VTVSTCEAVQRQMVLCGQDLIIEAVYADIVRGKLDQKHQLLEVDYAIGRDIQQQHVQEITDVLENW